jgi:hypothetical protein
MKESTRYQAIVEEGRFQEVRELLFRLGEDQLRTKPTPEQHAAIEGITDLARLEELVLRAPHVPSWARLLAPETQRPGPRRAHRKTS